MGLISWIVVGAIAGMLARRIVPGPDPGRFIVTLIVGMAGVSLGGFVMGVLGGSGTTGFSVWSVMMATLGAVVSLYLYGLIVGGPLEAKTRRYPRSGFGQAAMSIISGTATYLRAVRSAFGRIVAPDGSPAEAKRKPPKEGLRSNIEGLRAVAVGAVLLYHAGVPFAPGGYVGVDVFFVISGFLITGLLVPTVKTCTQAVCLCQLSYTLVMGGHARSPHLSGHFFHLRSFVAKAQHNDKMALRSPCRNRSATTTASRTPRRSLHQRRENSGS